MQTAFVRTIAHSIWIAAFAVFVSGCATSGSGPLVLTPEERIQRDREIGAELANQFESHFKFKPDRELQVYLRGVAKRLIDASPELKGAGAGVLVLQDRGGLWRCFGFTGNRMYLSSGLLRGSEFENEVAAVIAVELAHIHLRHPLIGLRQMGESSTQVREAAPEDYISLEGLFPDGHGERARVIDYFGPTGMFSYSDEFYLDAAEAAVGILYQAGFDARGLVALWERYQTNIEHSPYDGMLLEKLLEKTRRVIALYSPLRNPIVRSQAFISIQKRMRGL